MGTSKLTPSGILLLPDFLGNLEYTRAAFVVCHSDGDESLARLIGEVKETSNSLSPKSAVEDCLVEKESMAWCIFVIQSLAIQECPEKMTVQEK